MIRYRDEYNYGTSRLHVFIKVSIRRLKIRPGFTSFVKDYHGGIYGGRTARRVVVGLH